MESDRNREKREGEKRDKEQVANMKMGSYRG